MIIIKPHMSLNLYTIHRNKCYTFEYLEKILRRNLTKGEKTLICMYNKDVISNQHLLRLYNKCKKTDNNLSIKKLTKRNGNSFFESLVDLDIFESVSIGRKFLVYILCEYEHYEFTNIDGKTLCEYFNELNNIHGVLNTKDYKYYEYSYNTMIYDLNNEYSISRIPLELLCFIISQFLDTNIIIINNHFNNQTTFNDTYKFMNRQNKHDHSYPDEKSIDNHIIGDIVINYDNKKTIYIGHVYKNHYVALDIDNKDTSNMFYLNSINKAKEWIDKMLFLNKNNNHDDKEKNKEIVLNKVNNISDFKLVI